MIKPNNRLQDGYVGVASPLRPHRSSYVRCARKKEIRRRGVAQKEVLGNGSTPGGIETREWAQVNT